MYWAYHTLKLPYGADLSQVRSAYRELAKRYHPDRFSLDCSPDISIDVARERFEEVQRAYEWLVGEARKTEAPSSYVS